MALKVGVANPGKLSVGNAPKINITHVGVATPGKNGFATLVPPSPPKVNVSAAQQQNNSLANQTNALLAAIRSMQNSQPRQVYAPALNFASINAQARAKAEGAVNPYYTKQLNDFLAEQGAKRQQAEVQNQTIQKSLEEDLQNKLQENQINQERTGQDVAQNLDTINTQQDQFQTDSGQQFTTDRLQQARDLSAAGLTGGLGAQQSEATKTARNTTESRQTAQADQQKQQQQVFKARTFEDLARSGTLAGQSKERSSKEATVSLADFITNQGFETESKKSQLEAQRLQAVAQEQSNQGKLLVNNFIAKIADPAKRQAAQQAYGGSF